MTVNEKIVLREITDFLERFNDPPAMDAAESAQWWDVACEELLAMSQRCRNHPLMIEAGAAVFGYLETKAKAKGA